MNSLNSDMLTWKRNLTSLHLVIVMVKKHEQRSKAIEIMDFNDGIKGIMTW